MVGDDVAEFTVDPGIVIGIAMGNRELTFLLMGDPRVPCVSLKCDNDGETARRFDAEGYGSKRSSTFSKSVRKIKEHSWQHSRFRLFDLTAEVVLGGGVHRQ